MAYADNLLIVADNKEKAIEALTAISYLKQIGLTLNTKKSQIITDREDLKDVTEIADIKIQDNIEYLGFKIFYDRQKTVNSAKEKAKKYLEYLKIRIITNNQNLAQVIFLPYSDQPYFIT